MPNKTWIRIENSSFDRASYPFIKKVIYGILAGVFTGIAYSATLIMLGNTSNQTLGKFLGGIMYCTGILMCMFVGANLFPTNCFIYASILEKKVKRREYYLDLLITFISNWIGSIAIAGIVYGVGTLNDITKKVQEVAIAKVELEWWKTLLSGIITNVLVVSCAISLVAYDNKTIAFVMTLIMITTYSACGFQHIVANQFLTMVALFYGAFDSAKLVGEIFYNCLLFSMIGNFIGGVALILGYWLALNKLNLFKK